MACRTGLMRSSTLGALTLPTSAVACSGVIVICIRCICIRCRSAARHMVATQRLRRLRTTTLQTMAVIPSLVAPALVSRLQAQIGKGVLHWCIDKPAACHCFCHSDFKPCHWPMLASTKQTTHCIVLCTCPLNVCVHSTLCRGSLRYNRVLCYATAAPAAAGICN
jgi:hypothetical protein